MELISKLETTSFYFLSNLPLTGLAGSPLSASVVLRLGPWNQAPSMG